MDKQEVVAAFMLALNRLHLKVFVLFGDRAARRRLLGPLQRGRGVVLIPVPARPNPNGAASGPEANSLPGASPVAPLAD